MHAFPKRETKNIEKSGRRNPEQHAKRHINKRRHRKPVADAPYDVRSVFPCKDTLCIHHNYRNHKPRDNLDDSAFIFFPHFFPIPKRFLLRNASRILKFSEGILLSASAINGICDASAQILTELVQFVELNCLSENLFNLTPAAASGSAQTLLHCTGRNAPVPLPETKAYLPYNHVLLTVHK